MATLRIEHAITDFETWRSAFDRFAEVRADRGVLATRVHRPLDDDQYVLIDLEFATADAASDFEEFLRTRIWSTPENAPALAGSPITRILRDEPVPA